MLFAGRRADTPTLRCAAEVPRLDEECHARRPGGDLAKFDLLASKRVAVALWRKDDTNLQLPQSSRRSSGGRAFRRDVTADSYENGPAE
jgi:hypothetical protein